MVFLTFITEDTDSQPAEQVHAEQWAQAFGLDQGTQTPVVADGGKIVTSGFTGRTLPSLVLLDPDLRWVVAGQDANAELPILNELERVTGNNAAECHAEE